MPLSDAWVDFLAGWCSGAAAVVACQPVDTVLTRMQAGVLVVASAGTSGTGAAAGAAPGSAAATATTTAASVGTAAAHSRTLLETAGIRALWRGASPMITAVPLQNALLMGGYGVGQKYAAEYAPQHKLAAVFIGGCTGGVLQSFLMSPVELIKVSQQCGTSATTTTATTATTSSSAAAISKLLWQADSAVWRRGLGATLLRDGLPHGVWFWAYEVTKEQLTTYYQGSNSNSSSSSGSDVENTTTTSVEEQVVVPLIAGACAATAAWAVGYPADLIKTRIQAGTSNCSQGTIIGTARQLIQESGGSVIQGLYRGFGLKLVRSVPASMIGFSVYEFVKKRIENNL
jgi:solute carrier family 25 carnitine/acylcarnitine transporter 20/29